MRQSDCAEEASNQHCCFRPPRTSPNPAPSALYVNGACSFIRAQCSYKGSKPRHKSHTTVSDYLCSSCSPVSRSARLIVTAPCGTREITRLGKVGQVCFAYDDCIWRASPIKHTEKRSKRIVNLATHSLATQPATDPSAWDASHASSISPVVINRLPPPVTLKQSLPLISCSPTLSVVSR